jgi:hypothetical protein
MTWVRFDDQFTIHRKVAPLDDATYRLLTEAVFWCARNTTDGRIAADELSTVSPRATKPRVANLVRRGSWHEAGFDCASEKCPKSGPDGWVIHDYLEYQPTKEKVKAELAAKAERTRRWRERKNGDASRDPPNEASRDGTGDASSIPSPSPPRPAPKEGGAGAPQHSPAANGGVAAAGGERKATSAGPKCERCGNPATSGYHRRVCAPAEIARMATGACRQCDPAGYLPGGAVCSHDPTAAGRSQRGAAAVRAALTKSLAEEAP